MWRSLTLFSLSISFTYSQSVTYYQHIAPIVEKNCVTCHRPNGLGPFPLTTYEEVKSKGSFIAHVTKIKYMPPWHADPSFRTFRDQLQLTDEEINKIGQWVAQGMQKGKKTSTKLPVVASRTPDASFTMTRPFTIPDKGIEEFRFFNVPTGLSKDYYLSGVEFIPGNPRYVHHSRVMLDTTGNLRAMDGMSERDPKVYKFQKTPLADEFLYGWVPGNQGVFFPPGTGRKIYKETDLILNIHYSPSSKEQQDQSSVRFYFAKGKVDREVQTLILREDHISNQPFRIPAGALHTFYISYTIDKDISLISIQPHMHFLGKSFVAVAATPEGDAIPLIKIDQWDFNWQRTYVYPELLKVPAGSVILVQATYDNRAENPANPNHPPRDVGYGWNSTDEMCNLIFYYLDYRAGDEHISN